MLLLTDEDDFNALASVLLADCVQGRVYRLAPPLRSHGVVAPYTGGEILFGDGMTRPTVMRPIPRRRADHRAACRRHPAGRARHPVPGARGRSAHRRHQDRHTGAQEGDTIVSLGPVPVAESADGRSRR